MTGRVLLEDTTGRTVNYTGYMPNLFHNSLICDLKHRGYARLEHEYTANGCKSYWTDGHNLAELTVTVDNYPIVTGWERMAEILDAPIGVNGYI